jgi:hypothetical protein
MGTLFRSRPVRKRVEWSERLSFALIRSIDLTLCLIAPAGRNSRIERQEIEAAFERSLFRPFSGLNCFGKFPDRFSAKCASCRLRK